MRISEILVFILFLLYFWYFYYSYPTFSSKPPATFDPAVAYNFNLKHSGLPNNFQIQINGKILWEDDLPEQFHFSNGKISSRGVCHNKPDGSGVPAKGPVLYEYMKNHVIVPEKFDFEWNALYPFQGGDSFYFKCENQNIEGVYICPPTYIFVNNTCLPISRCIGQKDGRLFTDLNDSRYYYKCFNQREIREECPVNEFFIYDKCEVDVANQCQNFNFVALLDERTKLQCIDKKSYIRKCPDGFKFFTSARCESTQCINQPDGTRIPLPELVKDNFKYSPGYVECDNERVTNVYTCPSVWDPYLSQDQLPLLPMAFDGKECSVPEFCTNVTSNDPNTIVPVYDFTKRARNWKYSDIFDRVRGYRCQGDKRKLENLPAGECINKRFKRDYACDGTMERVPVAKHHDKFFDCATGQTITCPYDHFFNGEECQEKITHSFQHGGIDLFRWGPLSHDGWIELWNYAKNIPSVEPCDGEETEYLKNYNVCSHPDCTKYSFLTQIQFFIKLHNEPYKCIFEDGRLKKEAEYIPYQFWSQRFSTNPEDINTCTPGQLLQTGHFVWDSTIYATCDMEQPFVFCPSPYTDGLVLVDGNRYACNPKNLSFGYMAANTTETFQVNQVEHIAPFNTDDPTPHVKINNGEIQELMPEGLHFPEGSSLKIWTDQKLKLEYRFTITYPPFIAFEKTIPQRYHDENSTFLIKIKDFTNKTINFPSYAIEESVPSFMYN